MTHLKNSTPGTLGALGAASTGIGGALSTVVASTCCLSPALAPLIVGVVGASGAAWAAGLQPYNGYILAGSFVMLAAGFWMAYRPDSRCEANVGGRRWVKRATRGTLWVGSVLWTASVLVQLIVP